MQETLDTPPRGHLASVDGRARPVVARVLGFRGGLRVTPACLGDAGCALPHCIASAGTPGWSLALRRDPLSVWARAQDWRFVGARPRPAGSGAGPYRRVLRWMLCEERARSCTASLGLRDAARSLGGNTVGSYTIASAEPPCSLAHAGRGVLAGGVCDCRQDRRSCPAVTRLPTPPRARPVLAGLAQAQATSGALDRLLGLSPWRVASLSACRA